MVRSRLAASIVLAVALAAGIPAGASGDAETGLERIPRIKVLAAAREIDRLVEEDLAAKGMRPNAMTDDAAFVRRAYLDLVGRIPTAQETLAFLSSSADDRREALIDRLLESPGYASHTFNWLADLLRVKSRPQNQISGEPYIHFLKETLAANRPWDAFVREMLTASGNANKRGNGATGYYLRDRGMVEDNMSNTITLFLGTRLECAQCHNHPFDKWTQRQYHEMVAFTGGLRFTDDGLRTSDEGKRLEAMGAAMRTPGKDRGRSPEYRAFQQILRPLEYGVSGTGTGLYRLPKDYQYEDAKPNEVVKAKPMFGKDVDLKTDVAEAERKSRPGKNGRAPAIRASDINSREAYAKWLTSPENPRFTTVIANRLWKRMFGLGVIEPVDNMKEGTQAVNEPLMKHLEKTMVEVGYDLKQYLRVLANSRTYQREASRTAPSDEEAYRFPGPLLRRMSAEQLWDSMVTLVVPDVDGALLKPGATAEPVYAEYERLLAMPEEELKQRVELQVLRETDPAKFRERQRELTAKAKAEQKPSDAEQKLQAELEAARKSGDKAAAKRIQEELRKRSKELPLAMMSPQGYRRGDSRNALARASDLEQPAKPGHFLREFGQSDREQIEGSHTEGAVPQALSLLNGFVDKTLLPNKSSAVRKAAEEAKGPAERVRSVFLSILNREPAAGERDVWVKDVDARNNAAIGDLIWTLVNTHEFMFIR